MPYECDTDKNGPYKDADVSLQILKTVSGFVTTFIRSVLNTSATP